VEVSPKAPRKMRLVDAVDACTLKLVPVAGGFAVGASYIWRRYGNFNYEDRVGISTADWVARSMPSLGKPTKYEVRDGCY